MVPPLPLLIGLVAVAGAATMVVELAAVRLLAPWFGASAPVWTNVIGVILAGLALGYLLGARLSNGERPGRSVSLVTLAAAVWIAATPAVAGRVSAAFLPAGVALHEATGLLVWGSLATTLIVFLPAALFLGAIGPLGVELMQRATGMHAGAAGGRVLGASTLGSLAGVFGTTHLLVPELGLEATFRAAAVALLVVGAGFLLLERAWRRTLGGVALVLLASARLGGVEGPPVPDGVRVLEAGQSSYQAVRVVADERGDPPLRQLQVNEGLDSYQSIWRPEPGLFGEGYYYDLFVLPTYLDPRPRWDTLQLGLGAGSTWRVFEGARPAGTEATLLGIEIDPLVVELGRRWCDLPAEGGAGTRILAGLDGRAALAFLGPDARFDLIVIDAYANQVEIPVHLSSREFFARLRSTLRPGGWLAANVGGFGFDDPVVRAVAATLAAAFEGRVLALRVPHARNYVLFARRDAEPPAPPFEDRAAWSARGPAGEAVAWMAAPLELDGAWRFLDASSGPILTDDKSAIERLQARSIAEAHERRSALP